MIPIRDTNRADTFPLVNHAIIAVNVLIFFLGLSQGQRYHELMYIYGLVPARYSVTEISSHFSVGQQVIPFLTFMFLHGGFLHLLGNMWSLYIFGDNVEDRLGPLRYLVFYLLCGLASGISHLALNWQSNVPTIGASGAISGVMGAYFILYPKAKVLALIPIFFFLHFVEVPAFVFLGIWFVFQFLSAAGTSSQAGGIAWWAHIGGFIFGIIFLKLFTILPEPETARKLRNLTKKRKTPRLQVIRPEISGDDPNLYGSISINEREAQYGVRKLIKVSQGPSRRTFSVTVPPGVSQGTVLRLQGMGRRSVDGERGDLYLRVQIRGR
jgi:membrane associated rhomboid family serine protease